MTFSILLIIFFHTFDADQDAKLEAFHEIDLFIPDILLHVEKLLLKLLFFFLML